VRAPEITYRYIYPKDIAGPTFEILTRSLSLTASAASLNIPLNDIPLDKVLVLNNASLLAGPDATQVAQILRFEGVTAAGLTFTIAESREVTVAGLAMALNWSGEVFLAGGGRGNTTVNVFGNFDSGAQPNFLQGSFSGTIIPRANIATF